MDEFSVTEPENTEDEQILAELQKEEDKESVMKDFDEIFAIEKEKDFCNTCTKNPQNGGNCGAIIAINGLIKRLNGRYRATPISPMESRWGCTNHTIHTAEIIEAV